MNFIENNDAYSHVLLVNMIYECAIYTNQYIQYIKQKTWYTLIQQYIVTEINYNKIDNTIATRSIQWWEIKWYMFD